MRTRQRTLLATGLVALLTIAGLTAAIANDPPPRIAFLANGIVPADALAAGPIAGQLGAPIFTTAPDTLPASTADALDDYNPQLVIVMGGPVAISDAVVAQVSAATGLSVVGPNPPPSSGIVRAAGEDRFETAAAAAALLAAYDPAYLPTDMKAIDSDKLDGKDSTAFLGATAKAADADKVDGKDSTAFLGKTEKAADSDKLDGKDSSAFLQAGEFEVFSNNWIADGVDLSPNGGQVNTATGGFMINFADATSHIAGIDYSVAQIELCYATGANAITSTEISGIAPNGSTVGYINDGTVRSGQACDTFAFGTPVALAGGVQPLIAITFNGAIAVRSTRFLLVPTASDHTTAASMSATSVPAGSLNQ